MANKSLAEQFDAGIKAFEPLPAGSYDVEVTSVVFTRKQGKNPYFVLDYKVISGPNTGKNVRYQNITFNESDDDKNGYFFNKMSTLGIADRTFWASFATIDDAAPTVAQALIGRKATLVLRIKEFGGKFSNEVDKILPLGGSLTGGVPGVPTLPNVGLPQPTTSAITLPNLPAGL